MFRKPKKSTKASFRKKKRRSSDDDDDGDVEKSSGPRYRKRQESDEDEDEGGKAGGDEDSTRDLLEQLRRERGSGKSRPSKKRPLPSSSDDGGEMDARVMHQFESTGERLTAKDLATREAQHHPTDGARVLVPKPAVGAASDTKEGEKGGIYTGQSKVQNPFHAGPLKAPTFVRTTCRFDYQPDICKDYKDTGFCGFGDTCIYLHDRGDTLSGWQLEAEYEERKKKRQEEKEKEMERFLSGGDGSGEEGRAGKVMATATEDNLPFACHICRGFFKEPVVTTCGHYFCQACITAQIRGESETEEQRSGPGSSCPICGKDTHGVFNHPTKLVSKKRRLVGNAGSWEEFAAAASKTG